MERERAVPTYNLEIMRKSGNQWAAYEDAAGELIFYQYGDGLTRQSAPPVFPNEVIGGRYLFCGYVDPAAGRVISSPHRPC